jgi:CHAT domain-containing protein
MKGRNLIETFANLWVFAIACYEDYPYLSVSSLNDFDLKFADIARRGLSVGIAQAEELRSGLGVQGADIMARALYFYYAGVDFEALFSNTSKAFEYSESLRSRGFLEQLGTEAALRLPGITAEERKRIQDLTGRIENYQKILVSWSGGLKAEDNTRYADISMELTKAEAELAVQDTIITKRIPRYGELRKPRPVSVEQAKAWCGVDRAVLEFVFWDDSIDYMPMKGDLSGSFQRPLINSYCLILTQGGVSAVPLDHDYNYLYAVNSLRDSITLRRELAAMEEYRNSLYAHLIKPLLPYIPANITDIVIVPDGELAYLPWDILRENSDSRDFGDIFRLSLSPSISVSVMAEKTGEAVYEPLLAFGGAWYDKDGTAADRADRGIIFINTDIPPKKQGIRDLRWPDLPGTVDEVKNLQGLGFRNPPTVFLGREVSEAKIKELSQSGVLRNYPLIHFACHGYFDKTKSSLSSIIFSEVSGLVETEEDGYLSIPEIAVLDLDARMVVLSACQTGLGQIKRGDGMVGLTRSFLVAGAGNVGVSLWAISDDATVEFMTAVYGKVIENGVNFREAYYQTKKEFRQHPKWTHPLFWAGFTIYE